MVVDCERCARKNENVSLEDSSDGCHLSLWLIQNYGEH